MNKGQQQQQQQQRYVESLTYGVDLVSVPDIVEAIREYGGSQEFSFICAPICHPRNRRYLLSDVLGTSSTIEDDDERVLTPLLQHQQQQFPWTRSDTVLTSQFWSAAVVGKLSPWLSLDSPSAHIRTNSSRVFWQEITWAAHLGLSAVLLPPPASPVSYAHYAHFINEVSLRLSSMQLWLRMPLSLYGVPESGTDDDISLNNNNGINVNSNSSISDTWSIWNRIRLMCDHSERLSLALEITEDLPEDDAALRRWLGEPIKALVIPTSIFLTSEGGKNAGAPYLPPRHRAFIASMMALKPHVIIAGTSHHKTTTTAAATTTSSSLKSKEMNGACNDLTVYRDHVEEIRRAIPPMTFQESFESPYYDFLQAPLQPLADNLESQTYEVFEKDPVKYVRYEEAIRAAVLDMSKARTQQQQPLVLMVVGAGRGPLMDAAIRVAADTGVPLRLYAIEKNPNALVTLRNKRFNSPGWDAVTVVESDMRDWVAPEKADIIVSELLGSFGDNELSPECLDGAQRFLKDGGISIPYAYTSYIAPVSTSRLFNEVRSYEDVKHFEIPYVVKMHNFCQMAPSKPCFTFTHPNRAARIDNTRYACVSFTNDAPTIIHGVAGYFQAMLYKDINISINPQTFSDGMFSWFPVFFPIRTPVVLQSPGLSVEVHFWRQADRNKVWYEWAITAPSTATPVHNPNGRSYYVGLH